MTAELLRISARRVLARSVPAPIDGCIWWTGAITKGYGRIRVGGRSGWQAPVHRVVYEHLRGPVPEGMELDHACHSRSDVCTGGWNCLHRRCVNPDHLEVVTPEENLARRWSARKTVCVNGHSLEDAHRPPSGGRKCRQCGVDRQRAYNERQRRAA
jgi:hypothetical protein